MEQEEIIPFFQPQISLKTGVLSGFEILARWRHPQRGLISPADFIPIAEEAGLINPLTESLLAQASILAANWPEHLTLSINISPLQLRDRSLPERIEASLRLGQLPTSRLTVEILETALLEDLETSRLSAEHLKALGIRLSLDGFGTGFSNLRYLQALAIDELKIDPSFIRPMIHQVESRKIVAAIVGLGHSLNISVVGKGIESQTQADMLAGLGCDIAQGWLFGWPMPGDQVSTYLTQDVQGVTLAPVLADTPALPLSPREAERQSELLQAIYDSVPVGLGLIDRTLHFLTMNQRLAGMNAGNTANIRNYPASEFLPDVFQEFEPHLRRALEGESASDLEIHRSMPGGGARTQSLLLSYEPVRGKGATITAVSIAVIDITRGVRAKEMLRTSETIFGTIFSSAPTGIALLAWNGTRIRSNPALCRILGYPEDELEGMSIFELTHSADAKAQALLHEELLSGKRDHYEIEKRYLSKDGRDVWVKERVSSASVFGGTRYLIGVIEDVTEKKAAEEALRQLSAKILKAQDQERRRIARELHDSVSQLQVMASLCLAQVSFDGLSDENRTSLTRCKELIDTSTQELRSVSYLLHPPLLEELGLKSALNIYVEGFMERTGIKVTVVAAAAFPHLEIELELALFRVVQEALTNILRHSKSKWAEIRMTVTDTLVLEIEDRGIGFPKGLMSEGPRSHRLGVGIAGMRERLRQFGGTIQLLPAAPGAIVRVIVPDAGSLWKR